MGVRCRVSEPIILKQTPDEVFARPLRRNAPSRRVLEKLGFTAVAEEMREHPKWTEDDPVVRYVLTRPPWRSDAE